jgi:glycosyltransferase involved in cell wall biosynthesis
MDKLRVIMTGPMPPNVGGMATVLNDLRASKLASQVELIFLNTAKTTREDRRLTEAMLSKLRLWSDWVRLLKSKSKTIAHIHTCSGFSFLLDSALICLAKCCAVPVVLHVHGAKFDKFLDSLNPVLQGLARWLFRRCESVIVLSDSWRTELQNRLGPQNFSVIANGVPIRDDISIQTHSGTKVNVLFLGNLTERKGVFDLLEAMRYVDNAVLHLVGGEEQAGITDKVRHLVEQLQLNDKVILHGIKAGQDKQLLALIIVPAKTVRCA